MKQTDALVLLAQTLAAHRGVKHYSISMKIFGKGDFFHKLITKRQGCLTSTAETAFQWFDANWPADLQWPADIPRPSKTSKGRAA